MPPPTRGRAEYLAPAEGHKETRASEENAGFEHPPERAGQLQPLVAPQVMHLRHEPLRTRVKLWQLVQASPS